jgi:hypothetical protein
MRQKLEQALRYLLPGMGDMLWIAALAGALGFGPRMLNVDGDIGRHLTIGRYILEHGSVPTKDLFSHTMMGQPLTPHEWLSQAFFAMAHQWMGLNGVVLLTAVVIATCFCLVYRQSREIGRGLLPAVFSVVLVIAASSLHWLTRPHIFTMLMLVLWVGVLESMRRGRIGRWGWLPVLMVIWANLHGAFIAGFVTWFLYGAGILWDSAFHRFPKSDGIHGHFWRYYLLGGAAALAATLLNPSGLGLWSTSVGYVGSRYLVGHTAEYLPPNFHDPSTWPFLIMIGLLVVLLGVQNRRGEAGRPDAARVILSAAWLVMGLYSVRNVPLFAIVTAPLLAGALGDWLDANHHQWKSLTRFYYMDRRLLKTDLSLRGWLWPAVVFVLVVVGFQSGAVMDLPRRGNVIDPQVFPVQAVDWLKEHPQQGNVFNHFPWGGYLLYRMWPEQQVFIDGQTDFYGEKLTREYESVITLSSEWEDVLNKYEVDWVIIPADGALAGALREDAQWRSVYADETAQIFIR